jgi:hypothetical protein
VKPMLRSTRVRYLPVLTALTALVALCALPAASAQASNTQVSILEDNGQLFSNPAGTLAKLRLLGVDAVRLNIGWAAIAPDPRAHKKPKHFRGTDPASYPASHWAHYDAIVRDAQKDGISVVFTLTSPAPRWAEGSGEPKGGPFGVWKPSATLFGNFVRAIGTRYDGHYKPKGAKSALPAVRMWSIWNEPNYGVDLAPQAIDNDTIEVGAVAYRGLVNAGWKGLHASGHGSDTILIGETAPRGQDHPIGDFSGVKPLRFLRAVYCVGSNYQPLRGSAAKDRNCPTTASGTRAFRAANPALFDASGFADHPYAQGFPPNEPTYACGRSACGNSQHKSDPDYADLPELGRLEQTLNKLYHVYGSSHKLAIYSTEYGYWTKPPDSAATISPATAAYYMNWAEYLTYKESYVRSYDQYLLEDSYTEHFASGLEFSNGKPKATYAAFRLPLYLPVTTASKNQAIEVWGCVRPAPNARADTGKKQSVRIQFRRGSHGSFTTVKTVTITNSRGYFDVKQKFSASGTVRLAWTYPTGQHIYSRSVKLTIK